MSDLHGSPMLSLQERNLLLEQAENLWAKWDLHGLNALLSSLSHEQLLDEPMLGYRLAAVLVHLRHLDEATPLLQQLLGHVRQSGNDRVYSRATNVDGIRLLALGEYYQAQERFLRALELASRTDDQSVVATATNNLGIIASVRREFDGAILAYSRAIIAAQRLQNNAYIAAAHQNLGMTYREMGLLRSSDAQFEMALEIFRAVAPLRVSAVEGERALLQHAAGDSLLAEATVRRALSTALANQMSFMEAECYRVLGVVIGEERPTEAVDCFQRAIGPAHEAQNRLLEAEVLEEWAVLEHRRKNTAEATDLASRSKEIYLAMGADRRAAHVDERMA